LLFELGDLVFEAGGPLPVGAEGGLLHLVASGIQFGLQLAEAVELLHFLLPARLELARFLLEIGELLLDGGETFLRGGVLFLAQSLALDLQLHDAATHFVELRRHARRFHAQLSSRFVHEVDRLVGQKAIRDVAV